MPDPLTLLAFAMSTKYRSNKEAAKAEAAAKAEGQIINYVIHPKNGIRALNSKQPKLLPGEKLWGFARRGDKKITEYPAEEVKNTSLYQNPYDKEGPEITQKQYNAMVVPSGYSSVDTADSTTVTSSKLPLGKVVGHVTPSNEFVFYDSYKANRFPEDETTTVKYGIISKAAGKFVETTKNQKPTHTVTVTIKNGKEVRGEPKKIDVDTKGSKTGGFTEYKMVTLPQKDDGEFKPEISIASETLAISRVNNRTHAITHSRYVKPDGTKTEFKPYSATNSKNSINNVKRSKDVVTVLSFPTDQKDASFKTINKTFPIMKNQTATQNLMALDNFLRDNPDALQLINTDNKMFGQVYTVLNSLLKEFYLGPVQRDRDIVFTKVRPRDTDRANTYAAQSFPEIAKIRNFKEITTLAADLASDKETEILMKNLKINKTGFVVEKDVIKLDQNNNEIVDGSVKVLVQVPERYGNILKIISQRIGSVHLKKNVGGLVEGLISYKKDDDGKLLRVKNPGGADTGFSLVPSEDQPSLDFLLTLSQTNLGNKKLRGQQATFLDAFLFMIHPSTSKHPLGEVNDQIRNEVKQNFGTLVNFDFKKGMNVIRAFVGRNTQATNNLLADVFEKEYNTESIKEDVRGKASSAYNAIMTIDMMLKTYFTDDGGDIDIGTAQGELLLKVAGISAFVSKGFKAVTSMFRGGSGLDIMATKPNELANSLVDQADVYDSVNPNDSKEIAARERNKQRLENIKNIINGTGDINEFIKGLDKKTQASLKTERSQEILNKLAIRQYHKYMLAYQLAAAIQGGTGGRTISDQDVENIMKSLNFGFFTTASKEQATLAAARKMLVELYEYNNALLSTDVLTQFSAVKTRQLLMGTEKVNLFKTVAGRRAYFRNNIKTPKYSSSSTGEGKVETEFDKNKADQVKKFIRTGD